MYNGQKHAAFAVSRKRVPYLSKNIVHISLTYLWVNKFYCDESEKKYNYLWFAYSLIKDRRDLA